MSYAESEGGQRLLALADTLDATSRYTQATWFFSYDGAFIRHNGYGASIRECGTPACALGHYAASNSDRWVSDDGTPVLRENSHGLNADAMKEFSINEKELNELFGSSGCGGANKDGKKAAAYIRDFVFRKSQCNV